MAQEVADKETTSTAIFITIVGGGGRAEIIPSSLQFQIGIAEYSVIEGTPYFLLGKAQGTGICSGEHGIDVDQT